MLRFCSFEKRKEALHWEEEGSIGKKNVELEVGNSSKDTLVNEEMGNSSKGTSTLVNEEWKEVKGSCWGSVSNGKDGPRFKDLGGMKEVLEEPKKIMGELGFLEKSI